jgi:hypothetical protein
MDPGRNQAPRWPRVSQPLDDRIRTNFIRIALATLALATVHFADHAVRGWIVVERNLDPGWNHSGWPFQPRVSPFTFSLILVFSLLLGGAILTRRRKVWAGYWLAAAVVLGGVVTMVHFVPGPSMETPTVIYRSYGDNSAAGVVAVAVTFAIVMALIIMAAHAVWARRRSGHW